MADPLTQFLTTPDGRQLCYADWGAAPGGAPDGYPVFSLHGSPSCRLLVRAPETITEAGVRLITYDRPGYGHSDRRGPGTRVVDHVADVEAIADALGIDEFAVTGGSGGAPHALAVAARLPHRVSRVSNFGPIAPYELMGHDEWIRQQDDGTREYLGKVRESEATCTAYFQEMDDEMRAGLTDETEFRDGLLEQCRDGVMGWVDDERALQSPWGFDVSEVTTPAVIYGNPNDGTTPLNMSEWLVAHMPNATLVSSTNANGHCDIPDVDRWRRVYYAWLARGGEPEVP